MPLEWNIQVCYPVSLLCQWKNSHIWLSYIPGSGFVGLLFIFIISLYFQAEVNNSISSVLRLSFSVLFFHFQEFVNIQRGPCRAINCYSLELTPLEWNLQVCFSLSFFFFTLPLNPHIWLSYTAGFLFVFLIFRDFLAEMYCTFIVRGHLSWSCIIFFKNFWISRPCAATKCYSLG